MTKTTTRPSWLMARHTAVWCTASAVMFDVLYFTSILPTLLNATSDASVFGGVVATVALVTLHVDLGLSLLWPNDDS